MNIKEQIITVCQGDLEGKELINAIEPLLSLLNPFKHDSEFEFEACGIDGISIKISKDTTRTSELVEELEKGLTKRELAYALWQDHLECSQMKQLFSMMGADSEFGEEEDDENADA